MKSIGRRLYYDSNGNILKDTGERMGDVTEIDPADEMRLFNLKPETTFIELAFGERKEEFINKGSYHINPDTQELIIYPRLTIVSDKQVIDATTGEAQIVVTIADDIPEQIDFYIGENLAYTTTAINKTASLLFSSELTGVYTITAKSSRYGVNSLEVKVL